MNDTPAFKATEFSTVEDKQKFAKHFQRFVTGGFKRTVFPKWFYTRLSGCFGMIAHYNLRGFYDTYFETLDGKHEFIQECLAWPCYGSPEFTYSDVERHLQGWLKQYLQENELK